MSSGAYRRDIDGLRCLAVVPVVMFHAFPTLIAAGFIGVDVFFVISGFLISGQIQQELTLSRFRIANFYARRIRRIFPALTLVLLSTLALGWALLLPTEFRQLIKHVIAGAAFSSNFLLWDEIGYFDKASNLKPLLHLWSLGVEEQFYIIWPLVLMAVSLTRWRIPIVACALGATSFAACLWWIRTDPASAFYLPFSRFWELLLGAALAAVPQPLFTRSIARDILSLVGVLLVLFAMFTITPVYPGWRAVVPTIRAALLIGSGEQALINRLALSTSPAVWIGKISYPLYLWHWPLLSFLSITMVATTGTSADASLRLAAVALSIALAYFTYRLIETPIRRQPSPRFAVQLACGVIAVAVIAAASSRIDTLSVALGLTPSDAYEWPEGMNTSVGCRAKYGLPHDPEPFCVESKPGAPPDILVIGDSNANHWVPGIANAFSTLNVVNIGGGACLPIEGVESFSPIDSIAHQRLCRIAIDRAFSIARASKTIKLVILSARMTHHFPGPPYGVVKGGVLRILESKADGSSNEEIFTVAMNRTLNGLTTAGIPTAVVLQIPELSVDPKTCAVLRPTDLLKPQAACTVGRGEVERRLGPGRNLMFAVLGHYPNVTIYDPVKVLCDGTICRALNALQPLYRDHDHLSRAGSLDVWRRMTAANDGQFARFPGAPPF